MDTLIRRGITKELGVLPALSGLAQHMQKSGAGIYCAGIWADDLARGLMWCPPFASVYGRIVPYRAPSWSWASVKMEEHMPDIYNFIRNLRTKTCQMLCAVLETQCIFSGKDPLGAVSSGYLILSSPLLEARHPLPENARSSGWLRSFELGELGFWELQGVRLENNYFGSTLEFIIQLDIPPSTLTQAGAFHSLILGRYGVKDIEYFGIALELKDKGSSPNTFARVGWFKISNKDATLL